MLLKEFKYQEKHTKQQLLSRKGVFLCTRTIPGFTLYLFQMDSFYVEMYFDDEEEEIGYMRAFSCMDELAPYLEKIDLTQLLSN